MPLPTAPPVTPAATAVGSLRLVRRPGSGEYLESERGALLARVDRASGLLFLWDKKLGGEVRLELGELWPLLGTAPRALGGASTTGRPV